MKICYSWESYVSLDKGGKGDITQMKELVKSIADQGHKVYLVCFKPGRIKKIGNANVLKAPVFQKTGKLFKGKGNSKAYQLIRSIIKLNRTHNFDAFHFRSQGLVLEAKKHFPNKPLFYTMVPYYFFTKNKADFNREQKVIRACDKLFVFTEGWKAYYISTYAVPANKIELIGVGVNSLLFKPQAAKSISTGQITLGYFGGIRENYGIEPTIQALSLLNSREKDNYRLLIAGTGTDLYIKKINSLINRLNMKKNVQFLGSLDRTKIPYYLEKCDIAVNLRFNSSRNKSKDFNLSIPIKVVEYMMAGVPVLASRDGGIMELVGKSYPFLVNPHNPEEIAATVKNMVQNGDLSKQVIEDNFIRAMSFSSETIAKKYIIQYESVLKEKSISKKSTGEVEAMKIIRKRVRKAVVKKKTVKTKKTVKRFKRTKRTKRRLLKRKKTVKKSRPKPMTPLRSRIRRLNKQTIMIEPEPAEIGSLLPNKKILHLPVDPAGQMSTQAKTLRKLGVTANFCSYAQNKFRYSSGIASPINKIPASKHGHAMMRFTINAARAYDIFHFHAGQTCTKYHYRDLPYLKKQKKKLVMTYWGSEARRLSIALKYNRFARVKPSLKEAAIVSMLNHITANVDAVIVSDYELYESLKGFCNKIYLVRIAVDHRNIIPYYPLETKKIPLIVHAPSDRYIKGTDNVISAIRRLRAYATFEYVQVENMTNAQALEWIKKADIVIDQVRLGIYATLSIESMLMGKPVVAYIREDLTDKYPEGLPIVSANPLTLESKLYELIQNPSLRYELGVKGRKYAETYHDPERIARQLITIYRSL